MTVTIVWGQDAGWPRVLKDGGAEIVVYQPQPDLLDGITLQSRIAVSVRRPENKAPLYGALWVTATLGVDRDRDSARIAAPKVDRVRFADVPDQDVQSLIHLIEADAPRWDLALTLTRLKMSLQAAGGSSGADFRNDPPRIIVSESPAILLLLD